jgi:DNA-binding XRE family transcriptional regulator
MVSMWQIDVGRFVSGPVQLRNVSSAADDWRAESFQGLLLRCRGRSRLTQGALARRVGVHLRSVEDWESGSSYPSAENLRALIAALLDVGGWHRNTQRAKLRHCGTPRCARRRDCVLRSTLPGSLISCGPTIRA